MYVTKGNIKPKLEQYKVKRSMSREKAKYIFQGKLWPSYILKLVAYDKFNIQKLLMWFSQKNIQSSKT